VSSLQRETLTDDTNVAEKISNGMNSIGKIDPCWWNEAAGVAGVALAITRMNWKNADAGCGRSVLIATASSNVPIIANAPISSFNNGIGTVIVCIRSSVGSVKNNFVFAF
jgi:hypothetical protein